MPSRVWQLSKLAPALGLVVASAVAPTLAAGPPAAVVAAPATYPERIERLARVVRLWGMVRFHHPYLAYKEIDWDEALVAAAPRVLAAKSREEFAAAVRTLLGAMGDPVTRLVDVRHDAADGQGAAIPAAPAIPAPPAAPATPIAPPAPTPKWPQLRWVQEGVAVVDLGPSAGWSAFMEMREEGRRLGAQIGKAKGLVFDLRQPGAADVASFVLLEPAAGLLASRRTHPPAQRTVRHAGYHTQGPVGSSGGYSSFFETAFADDVVPVPGASRKRVVFVVNGDTSLPPLALAMQRSGDGFIVFEGSTAGWSEESAVQQLKVDLGEELWAAVRLSELVPEAGWSGLHADLALPPAAPAPRPIDGGAAATGDQDPALAAAIGLARGSAGSAPPAGTSGVDGPRLEPLPQGVWRSDRAYEEMSAPDLGHRVLAVARIWNVIHYFYAYLELIGDWDAVLPEFLLRMESAAGARPYALAVAEMMTRVADGHSQVTGGEIDRFFGDAGVPVALRRVEGSYVVTGIGDTPEVKASGLEMGDVVEAVDGEPAAARVERLSRYLPASTPAGLSAKVGRVLLDGPEGSTAELTLRGRQGAKQVKLRRSRAWLDLGHSKLLYNNPFWSTAMGERDRKSVV